MPAVRRSLQTPDPDEPYLTEGHDIINIINQAIKEDGHDKLRDMAIEIRKAWLRDPPARTPSLRHPPSYQRSLPQFRDRETQQAKREASQRGKSKPEGEEIYQGPSPGRLVRRVAQGHPRAGQEGTREDRAPVKTRLVMVLDHESVTVGRKCIEFCVSSVA
ncbi:uncharacterized protein FRV6_01702 [Fusarium oxysporum]|uniref:Uncharacterized protein n=1 Tax=Fusarium oxysporum TaxID=5507 RepID=A0A2H3T3J0_FUSOX|nr:uncharacterized protein FRV6_01702 [Fusarium oxysporum]